jgi:hypothetical protein
MLYTQARPSMRTGDPLCTDSPGLIGKGIKRVTGGRVSHTAGIIELPLAGERRLFVIEATRARGVQLVALSTWIKQRARGPIYWWPAGFSEQERDAYAGEVLAHVGEPYEEDRWMLARVVLHMAPPPNARWYCSELDAAGRRAAQPWRFGLRWPPERAVWPSDTAAAFGGLARAVLLTPEALHG